MRIISKEHDYYDALQRHTQYPTGPTTEEKSTTSDNRPRIRNKKEVTYGWDDKYPFPNKDTYFDAVDCKTITVGFCGKIYVALVLGSRNNPYNNRISKTCWDIDDVDAFFKLMKDEERISEKQFKGYNSPKVKNRYNAYRKIKDYNWYLAFQRVAIVEFFDNVKANEDSFTEWFAKEKTPIFIAQKRYRGHWDITYNAVLKDVEFYRVFDCNQAFQKLEMYMANLAFPEVAQPKISDELKVETHGFDKFSFRKDKKKK